MWRTLTYNRHDHAETLQLLPSQPYHMHAHLPCLSCPTTTQSLSVLHTQSCIACIDLPDGRQPPTCQACCSAQTTTVLNNTSSYIRTPSHCRQALEREGRRAPPAGGGRALAVPAGALTSGPPTALSITFHNVPADSLRPATAKTRNIRPS